MALAIVSGMTNDGHNRPLWDTTRGIEIETHHLRNKFWVRCVGCGELFGPYFTLAEAQAVSRCSDCDAEAAAVDAMPNSLIASDPAELDDVDDRPLAEQLLELYEHFTMTGDSEPLRRRVIVMRRNMLLGPNKVAAMVLDAAIPYIDLDGAEWLIEELGLGAEEV